MTVFSTEALAERRILARIHRGRRLREALHELVDTHGLKTAWLSALGAFEWIELTEYSQTGRDYEEGHRFETCELLSMQGNLSERDGAPFWHLHATVSRRERGREVVYGGHVLDGVVFAMELRLECYDHIVLPRLRDEPTGLDLWSVTRDSSSSGAEAKAGATDTAEPVTWAMAAEASTATPSSTSPALRPMRGEWLDHPKFGICKIESLSGDGVCIIKLPDARRKKIQLAALQLFSPRQDGSRTIYPVRSKSKA